MKKVDNSIKIYCKLNYLLKLNINKIQLKMQARINIIKTYN